MLDLKQPVRKSSGSLWVSGAPQSNGGQGRVQDQARDEITAGRIQMVLIATRGNITVGDISTVGTFKHHRNEIGILV